MSLFNKNKGAVPIAPPQDDIPKLSAVVPEVHEATPAPQPKPVAPQTPVETVEEPEEETTEEEPAEEEPIESSHQPRIVEVPTYLSQDKINELIIQNNIILREILSRISQDEE